MYTEELRFLGHGRPVYEPGPVGYDRVRIGDVGVFTEAGAFKRCFNVFHDEGDPINAKFGVPQGFIVADKKYAEENQYIGIEAGGILKSEHIQSIKVSGSVQILARR